MLTKNVVPKEWAYFCYSCGTVKWVPYSRSIKIWYEQDFGYCRCGDELDAVMADQLKGKDRERAIASGQLTPDGLMRSPAEVGSNSSAVRPARRPDDEDVEDKINAGRSGVLIWSDENGGLYADIGMAGSNFYRQKPKKAVKARGRDRYGNPFVAGNFDCPVILLNLLVKARVKIDFFSGDGEPDEDAFISLACESEITIGSSSDDYDRDIYIYFEANGCGTDREWSGVRFEQMDSIAQYIIAQVKGKRRITHGD